MSFSRKSPRFCRFNLFLYFVKIAFTWLRPTSYMVEVWKVSKKVPAAALSWRYLVAVLTLLQYSLWFLLTSELEVLSSSTDIAPIFAEVLTYL